MTHKFSSAFAVLFSTALLLFSPPAHAQSGDAWIQLFDGKALGDWDQVGETNWRVEDGAIVAD